MVFDSDGGRRSSRLYERSEKEGVCKREDSKQATPEDEVTKNDNEDRRRGCLFSNNAKGVLHGSVRREFSRRKSK
jgi:hypothetical protein